MNITAPFAYSEIVPVTRAHKVAWPRPGVAPAFTRGLNVVPLSFVEFGRACRDYPIVFLSGDEGKTFTAVALTGLKQGQNLFLRADGTWDATVYLPAYVRRHPFCMAKITVDASVRRERVVCVEKSALDEEAGEILFDEKGVAVPRWKEMEALLREYEADLLRSEQLCGILRDYGLLEPFTMQAVLKGGGEMNLGGMHRVDEKKLANLTADQCRTLLRKGIMGRIYAHALSLDNFARLVDRSVLAALPVH